MMAIFFSFPVNDDTSLAFKYKINVISRTDIDGTKNTE